MFYRETSASSVPPIPSRPIGLFDPVAGWGGSLMSQVAARSATAHPLMSLDPSLAGAVPSEHLGQFAGLLGRVRGKSEADLMSMLVRSEE